MTYCKADINRSSKFSDGFSSVKGKIVRLKVIQKLRCHTFTEKLTKLLISKILLKPSTNIFQVSEQLDQYLSRYYGAIFHVLIVR